MSPEDDYPIPHVVTGLRTDPFELLCGPRGPTASHPFTPLSPSHVSEVDQVINTLLQLSLAGLRAMGCHQKRLVEEEESNLHSSPPSH